jgi:hypothetical protein
MLDENPDRFSVTKERGQRERREFIVTRQVGISSVVQERADHSVMTVISRAHERRHPMFITSIQITDPRQNACKLFDVACLSYTPQIQYRSVWCNPWFEVRYHNRTTIRS